MMQSQTPSNNGNTSTTRRRRSSIRRASLSSSAQVAPDAVADLYKVCLDGDLETAKELVNQVDDINATDENGGASYVQYAIQSGNVELVRFLIKEKNGRIDLEESAEDWEAIATTIEKGHLEMVKYMVDEHDADMSEELDNEGLTSFHHACGECHFDIVKYLAEEVDEADTDETDNDGWTALHYAAMGGNMDIVRYLVDTHDLDAEDSDSENWTALHVAANRGHLDVVKYLLEECEVDRDDAIKPLGQNALHLAASEGRVDVVKYLVEDQDFDLMEMSNDEETPLHLATYYGQLDVVEYLVANCTAIDGAELHEMLHTTSAKGETPYECVLSRLENHDNEEFQPKTADFLRMYVTPMASPDMSLDSSLTGSQRQVAERTLRLVEETEVHEVSYHILEYLTLSDVIKR